MRRWTLAVAAAAVALPAVPAAAGGMCRQEVSEGSTLTVETDHACFNPVVNRVAVGATVTWLNASEEKHNLTGFAAVIGVHELVPGKPVRITFEKAGTYPYSCTLHPGMTGVVIAGDGAATVAAATSEAPQPVTLAASADGWTDSAAAVGGAGAGVLGLGLAGGFLAGRRRRTD